jgi:subtilisin family serine protease
MQYKTICTILLLLFGGLVSVVFAEDTVFESNFPSINISMHQSSDDVKKESIQIKRDYEKDLKSLPKPYQKMSTTLRTKIEESFGELPSINQSHIQTYMTPHFNKNLSIILIVNDSTNLSKLINVVDTTTENYRVWDGSTIKFVATELPLQSLVGLANLSYVQTVWYNDVHNISLYASVPAVNGDDVHSAGTWGTYADVGVIDTGVDSSHPDLDYVIARKDFTSLVFPNPDDTNGHGTHVAGIVGSSDSTYKGMAPYVDIISAKVIEGGTISGWTSTIISGIDWTITQGADVIQMSINNYDDGGTTDASSDLSKYVDYVVYVEDKTFVISAGNYKTTGNPDTKILAPADAYNCIAVGATDWNFDSVAWFSGHGPTSDARSKPDVVAPGEDITSCNNNWESQNDFVNMDGTSMAAPHVSGEAALLLDYKHGTIYTDSKLIKAVILNSATKLSGWSHTWNYPLDNYQGAGQIDAYGAYETIGNVNKIALEYFDSTSENEYFTINIDDTPTTLGVTLVWERHVSDHTTTPPSLNDLDLKLYQGNGDYLTSSASARDSVEHIHYSILEPGMYVIKVEPYSLNTGGWEGSAIAFSHPFDYRGNEPPFDTTDPSASISINSGAIYTDSTSVTLSLTYSDGGSGVAQCRYKNSDGSWTGWESCSSTKSWTLSSGDGTKTVYYQVGDKAGNIREVSDTITLDTANPSASISINSGATYTDTTSVTLSLTYSDGGSGVDQCRYKNSDGSWTGWESCSSSKSWTLSSGDGTKTVYYQVRDKAGNIREVSDTIILDTTDPPAPTISSVTHPNENNWYNNNDPSFTWNTPADTSGIEGYSYTIDHSSSTTPDTSVDTSGNSASYSNIADGTWYFHTRAKDNAGNWGSADHYTVRIDNANPSATLNSPNGGESWQVGTPHDITWTATDNVGVTSVNIMYSINGGSTYPYTIATGETNDGTYSWTIPNTPSTTCKVKVIAYDVADNPGEDVSNTNFEIYVEVPPPQLVVYTITYRTITPPQTTEIDVAFSEEVVWIIAIEGSGVIYDWSGTATNPTPMTWDGKYEVNGTRVPDGIYHVNVTGTSTTTGLSVANNTETITVTSAPSVLTSIEVIPSASTLDVGDPQQFTATAYDQFGNEVTNIIFAWTSSNTTVGTINDAGYFTALAAGATTINATNGSIVGSAYVTVVSDGLSGDINGDGAVDYKDGPFLVKHVLGIPGYETIHADGDVNCDGAVDYKDGPFLVKHVLGIPGYEHIC